MSRHVSAPLALCVLLLGCALVPPGTASRTASRTAGSGRAAPPTQSAVSPARRAAIQANYGRLSLAFEVNAGQADPAIRFLARGSSYALALTSTQALLSLTPATGALAQPHTLMTSPTAAHQPATMLGMQWLGANPHPLATGEQPLPGKVNYLIGNNPAQWHTNIAIYQQVRLHDIYPGVDLVFYGTGGQLEYDFVVAPGAYPGAIQLGFTGAQRLGMDLAGNLDLTLPGGAIQQAKPLVYQRVGGARQPVAGGYTLTSSGRVGFALGAYNPRLPLVIDPVYRFSTFLGGTGADAAFGIAIDSQGNAYVTGSTNSTDFPTTFQDDTFGGGQADAFVSELNPLGTALLYSTYLGGAGYDVGDAIAVDTDGSAIVTGQTFSTNFPVTVGAFQTTAPGGGGDAFVTKLTPGGSGFAFSTYLGGSNGFDGGFGMSLDHEHYIYVAGGTTSTNFPTGGAFAAYQSSSGGGEDAFVSELYPDGHGLYYSTYLGGSGTDQANAIAVDPTNFNTYITGLTTSTGFPTTSGVVQTSNAGGTDAFVTEFDTVGSVVWSTYLGGSGNDYGNAIALRVAAQDAVFVAGATTSSNFPTTALAFQHIAPGGGSDAFVTELAPDATSYFYSTYLGGTSSDQAFGITVDAGYHAYVTGWTTSTNFPTVTPLQFTNHGGSATGDAFVTVFPQSGRTPLYSSYLGGIGDDAGTAIAINPAQDVYLAGYTYSTDFLTTSGAYSTSYHGAEDAFVTRMQAIAPLVTTTGVFRPSNGTLYLKNSNTTGPADLTLAYGQPGDLPVTGDWIGQGFKTIGVYRNATFYLRNSNTTGVADEVIPFGAAGDLPVAGDWTGKGYDTIGVYRPSNNTFYLRNTNTAGAPDIVATFGSSGDVPIVGDWTNQGIDTIGIFRPSNGNVYLRNSNSTGFANNIFTYGIAGDKPVAGDWDGNGTDTIGVDRGGNFLLRNSNSIGPANLSFYLGVNGDVPIAGPWTGFFVSAPPPRGSPPTKPIKPTPPASKSASKSARRP